MHGVRVKEQLGSHDLATTCTSYIERQNLTMRMNMRPYTRLTRVLEETGEPRGNRGVALHGLQLRATAQEPR